MIDTDGDGVPDVILTTTTTATDVDGDGVPDVIELVTTTGTDMDGGGQFSEDEVATDEIIAVCEDLVDDS